jgi:quercetin dioxygenase-like cupin family protein
VIHLIHAPGERRACTLRVVIGSTPRPPVRIRRLDTRERSNSGEAITRRILLAAAVGAAIGAVGLALARHGYRGPASVRTLSERDVIETLNGREARVTMVEVSLEPAQAGLPHRHAGPIFGYVLEGEFGLGEEPSRTLKTGETFYEPGGALHRVSRNPSARTRVLVVILHPREAKAITTPAGKD